MFNKKFGKNKLKAAVMVILLFAAITPIANQVAKAEDKQDPPTFETQDSATWLDGWEYRKEITVSDNIEDYQTKITVSQSDDASDDVDCEGNCNNDFSDLRFACSNGTLVPYWIEEKTDGDDCTVWVNNNYNDTTLYMYYGNSGASDASNGDDTFFVFADWENSYDNWVDMSSNSNHVAAPSDTYSYSGDYSMRIYSPRKSGIAVLKYNDFYTENDFVVSYWIKVINNDRCYYPRAGAVSDNYNHISRYSSEGTKYYKYWLGPDAGYAGSTGVHISSSWEKIDNYFNFSSEEIQLVKNNGEQSKWHPFSQSGSNVDTLVMSAGVGGIGHAGQYYVDLYTIRKWTHGTEPSFSFSDEQIPIFVTNEHPSDGSQHVTGLLNEWYCNISSNENTDGTIECSNGDTMSWTDEAEGIQTLTFSDYLDYNTTYDIWVNISANGNSVNETYNFTTTTCKITGTITDDFWGGVSNVEVTANSTNVEYTTYTDSDGFYEFDDVEYGSDVEYNITASKFAYTFYADGNQYRIENLTRNVSNANFTAVHYFFEGTGTEDDPFSIRNCTHLNNMRLFLNYTFTLNTDIDCSDCEGFEPIGNETNPFNGTLNGGAYVISNLDIDSNEDYTGLFGYVEDSNIRNLGLKQTNISGGSCTGALAGYMNNTTLSNVFVYSNYSVEGTNHAGGLVGAFENSSVINSYARVNTTGTTYGGLFGKVSDSTVNFTYATGDVTGGSGLIASQSSSVVNNSYFDNQTSGTTTSDGGIGKNTDNMTSQTFWDTTNFSFPDIWFLDENQNDNYPILSVFTEITPPLLRVVNRAGSLTQQIHRYLNSSFNPEDYCFFNVTAFVPPERYMGHWNKNVSDKYFISTGDRTHEPDYNDTKNNYVAASRFTSDYTGYYEQIRVFTVWHGMYPAHLGAAVYSDDNGEPGELLGYTEAYTIQEGRDEIWFPDTSHVWIEMDLVEPVFMSKDEKYWLVATSNDSSMWRESKYGSYNLSTYSDFSWLLGRADGESTDNVKRLAYNVTLNIPDKEYVDPYGNPDYAYWKGDVWNATFDWPDVFDNGASWEQGVDSMTEELDGDGEPVPLTDLLIYATTTVDVSPVNITKVEMTWGTGQGESVVWDEPVEMSRVSPNMDYWEYNKTEVEGGDWNTWKMTLYDEFGNIESYDYYRWLKHGTTERITFQANVSSPGAEDIYKEMTNETELYSQDWVLYPYEAHYDDTPYIYGDNEGRKQVLRHEQGVDGSSTDTGYWRAEEPTDEYHERTCAFFVGSVFDENVMIPDDVTIDNAVMVWWQASGRQVEGSYWAPPYHDVGTNFHWGRSDIDASFDEFYIDDLGFGEWEAYQYDALDDTIAWQTFPETRRYLNDWINFEEDTWYGSDTPMDNSTDRITNYMGRQVVGKADFTSLQGTDYPNTFDSNSIYQLFMGLDYDAMWASGPNAALFNNRSHPSFIMFNVPDDETLKTMDSNNDGINDYEAIYHYGLHPFWDDTDNDGFTDIQELSRGTGANLYRDSPSDSNIILLKNATPMKNSEINDWETTLSIEAENPTGQNMDIKWYALRNFTFNDSYINQDQLLDGDWELLQTNSTVSDGTYSMNYVPASGDNYIAVNTTSQDGYYSNRTLTFSGPDRQINGTVTKDGEGLAGVQVTAEINGDTYSDYTNSDGYYLFENLTGGDYTITPNYDDFLLDDIEYFYIPKNKTVSLSTENLTVDFETLEGLTHSEPSPSDNSEFVNNSVNWSVLIEADYAFNWTIECSDGNSSSGIDETSGRKNLLLSDLDYYTEYTIWVNSSNANYSHVKNNEVYHFTVREEKTAYPGQPVDFTATVVSGTQIDLTWSKGKNTDYTYIRYIPGEYPPVNHEEGDLLYNGSGTEANVTGLEMETSYSFSAWSYNETYDSWSYHVYDTVSTLVDAIGDEYPTNNSDDAPLVFSWSARLTNPIGQFLNWTIECSNGQSTGLNDDVNGTKNLLLYGLEYSTQYTVWVNMTYNPTISKTYTFTTQDGADEESSLAISMDPSTEANITLNTYTWNPTAGVGEHENTSLDQFLLSNTGSVQVDITVNASSTDIWALATTPAHNQFNISYMKQDGSTWDLLSDTHSNFITDLAYNEDQYFGLQLWMPTSTSSNSTQTTTITFVATPD